MLSVVVPASFNVDTEFLQRIKPKHMLSGNKDTRLQPHTQTKGSGVFFKANIVIFALNHLDIYELAYLATNR